MCSVVIVEVDEVLVVLGAFAVGVPVANVGPFFEHEPLSVITRSTVMPSCLKNTLARSQNATAVTACSFEWISE